MKTDTLVSVIIPTYNRGHIISATVENVLAQTYPNLEVVIVDDGSTDNTQENLQRFGSRIRVLRQRNAGGTAARNRGIEISRGEIIAFQDSDDLWMPTKIARQVELLESVDQSVPCCITNAVLKFANQTARTSFEYALLSPDVPCEQGLWVNVTEVLTTRFVLFNQTVAIRRGVLEKLGGFDETLKFYEDMDLPLRLSLEGPWAFITEPLAIWNEGSTGSWSEQTRADAVHSLQFHVRLLDNFALTLEQQGRQPKLRKAAIRQLQNVRRSLAFAQFRHSSFPGASALADLLDRIERYRQGAFRRSPWYPKMRVQPMDRTVPKRQALEPRLEPKCTT
jgi:glycosyltransferase involved in cell wall biosynthesis